MGNTGMEKFSCRRKLRRLGAVPIKRLSRSRRARGGTVGLKRTTGHFKGTNRRKNGRGDLTVYLYTFLLELQNNNIAVSFK